MAEGTKGEKERERNGRRKGAGDGRRGAGPAGAAAGNPLEGYG